MHVGDTLWNISGYLIIFSDIDPQILIYITRVTPLVMKLPFVLQSIN
jgi:hypothetical protein